MRINTNDILEITSKYDRSLEDTVKETILKTYPDSIEELKIKGLIDRRVHRIYSLIRPFYQNNSLV